MKHTYQEMLDCIRREIKQRMRVYPRLIGKGSMTNHQAAHEITCMQAVEIEIEILSRTERLL